MNKEHFIRNYKKAFGKYELPIVFWYSDKPVGNCNKTEHCFIKDLNAARKGKLISFGAETISCGGGRVYTGFSEPLPHIKDFVSIKECYKQSPEMVTRFIDDLEMPDMRGKYINFVSIDKVEDLDACVGLIFFATPDVLAGLVSWVMYDTDDPAAVTVPFGSGCSSMVAKTLVEHLRGGNQTFLGLFDPSVRPRVDRNVLSLAIPMSRFKQMYHTLEACCLKGTPAWKKVKERIEREEMADIY